MYTMSLDSHYLNSVTAVPIKTTQWLDLFQSAKYKTHAKEHLETGKIVHSTMQQISETSKSQSYLLQKEEFFDISGVTLS